MYCGMMHRGIELGFVSVGVAAKTQRAERRLISCVWIIDPFACASVVRHEAIYSSHSLTMSSTASSR